MQKKVHSCKNILFSFSGVMCLAWLFLVCGLTGVEVFYSDQKNEEKYYKTLLMTDVKSRQREWHAFPCWECDVPNLGM